MNAPLSTDAKERAYSAYKNAFHGEPELLVRAPGRVNLIGEHTDYNDGFVLPCAIDRDTVVAVGKAADGKVTAIASDFGGAIDSFDPFEAIEHGKAEWANYVRGMAQHIYAGGIDPMPVQMAIAGDVPLGSGLSSSASLEIAVGLALTRLAGREIDPVRLAQTAQAAENQFVGCACGIMDQLISARGERGNALLIDCRSLETTPVPLPGDVSVIIAHSGVRHAHAGGEYNDRREQCETAARHYGVKALRDLSVAQLESGRNGLDDISYRRARHVVTENDRTKAAAKALGKADLFTLGRLMEESHISMRDDFEITVPATDHLAQVMSAPLNGKGGARQTGGGFGGCVVAVAPDALVQDVVNAVVQDYRTPGDENAQVFICQATAGAGVIKQSR